VEYAIADVEQALICLLVATTHDADRWDTRADELPWDGFSVPDDVAEAMSPELRLAYVGKLVRSLAHATCRRSRRSPQGHGTSGRRSIRPVDPVVETRDPRNHAESRVPPWSSTL
jgi:hypothetical protein